MSDSVQPHRRQPNRLPRPWDSPGKSTGVCCHFLFQYVKVKSESEVAQSCPPLSDPLDHSPPGSSTHGVFQARVLEWGAIAFSDQFTNQGDLSLSQPLLLQEGPLEVSRDSSLVWGLERDSGSSSSAAKKILGPIPVRPLPTKHPFPTPSPNRTQQNFPGDLSAARPDEQAEQMCCLISLEPGSKVSSL